MLVYHEGSALSCIHSIIANISSSEDDCGCGVACE